MNFLRLLGLLIALSYLPCASGADLPPDPARLGADWWDYFVTSDEDDPEALSQRIDTTSQRLSALQSQFTLDGQNDLVALTGTILTNLGRYEKFIAEPIPLPPLAKVAQDTYTLGEIRTLIEDLRKAGVKYAEEGQEIEQLQQAIAAGQRDLNQQKVDYRSMDENSPQRMRRQRRV